MVGSVTDAHDLWNWEERPKDERQAQSTAVGAAEFCARAFGPEDDAIEEDQVGDFLRRALSTSGFRLADPVVAFDLDDPDALDRLLESGAAGLLEHDWNLHGLVKNGVIHLHPGRLNKWTVLHELAHYIAPRGIHGPIWCRIYVDLVSGSLGIEAGDALQSNLLEQDAKVAPTAG
jgi:hypothetical protein